MSSIETEHRGYKIRFSENADEWSCYDLQDKNGSALSAPRLSTLKAAIDRMLLDLRKKAAFECYELNEYSGSIIACTLTEYIPGKARDHKTGAVIDVHKVASMAKRDSDRVSRKVVKLDELMPASAEALDAWNAFKAAQAARIQAARLERAAFAAIPRVSIDMIPDLVRASSGPDGEAA